MSAADEIKAAIALANDSFKAGHDEGYRLGFKEGLAAAQKIIMEQMSPVGGFDPDSRTSNG